MFARIGLGVAAMTAAALGLTGLTAAAASVATHPGGTASPVISEISTPGVESFNMAAGPKSSVWYTVPGGPGATAEVGEVQAGGTPRYFSGHIIQPGQEGEGGLSSITLGPDHNLWFTQSAAPSSAGDGVIYRVSSGAGPASEGPAGTIKYQRGGGVLPELGAITKGLGGDLYVAEPSNGTIAQLTPQGSVTPVLTGITGLGDLIYADGDLWYTAADAIGRVSVTGGSQLTIPPPVNPDQIVAGPVSASGLWFTTASTVTGPGGREQGALGMITTAGTPSYTLLTQGITGLGTFGITATSTQAWFTEGASERLGVLTP